MAGKDLHYDYGAMEDSAKKLINQGEVFEKCIEDMTREINGLPDCWGGLASAKYVEQFADLTPGFRETKLLIDKLSTQLTSIVNTMRSTDQDMADQVGVQK